MMVMMMMMRLARWGTNPNKRYIFDRGGINVIIITHQPLHCLLVKSIAGWEAPSRKRASYDMACLCQTLASANNQALFKRPVLNG
jgi:hypothetical protein